MTYIRLAVTAIFLILFCLHTSAQTTEPTLEETIYWIQDKINTYGYDSQADFKVNCGTHGSFEINDACGNCSYKGWSDIQVYKYYKMYTGEQVMKYRLSLQDVTSYEIDNYGGVVFYSKRKKSVSYGCGCVPEYQNYFNFKMQFMNEENLRNRFIKAVQTLVNYNTKNIPKETF